jgi:acyl-CoA hydrolase
MYAELAREEHIPLVPDIFAKVLADPDLKSDPVHPNAAGYRTLTKGIAVGLTNIAFLTRK